MLLAISPKTVDHTCLKDLTMLIYKADLSQQWLGSPRETNSLILSAGYGFLRFLYLLFLCMLDVIRVCLDLMEYEEQDVCYMITFMVTADVDIKADGMLKSG
ncbi:hypothetical protein Tco_1307074 [Tanacetum coccineum]